MNTEKRTARVFTPEQKFEILKDIEKQESVKAGPEKKGEIQQQRCNFRLPSSCWSSDFASQADANSLNPNVCGLRFSANT
jgi:hypothetical protein